MGSTKVLLILVLVALVAFDTANCYFRVGKEVDAYKREGAGVVKNAEKIILQRVLGKLAKCVMQVR